MLERKKFSEKKLKKVNFLQLFSIKSLINTVRS